MMSVSEVRVLGPVQLVGDGGPVALPSKHTRLLALLVMSHGHVVSVDEIVEAVWPDSPPVSARKLVQVYVSQLRKALPAGVEILTEAPGYGIQLAAEGLDAVRLETLLSECNARLRTGEAVDALALAESALALWRGRAYAEVADEHFARGESERLEELRLLAREARLDALLKLGKHDGALGDALVLAIESPFRERAHELAMLALYRCGRQADALAHYSAFRARLDDELGLEPGPALRALQRKILVHDPSLDLAAEDGRRQAVPGSVSSLVGRERELRDLVGLLTSRAARLVVLTGAGGSGKTRLALEAARLAAPSFANGAVLVELAPIRQADLVVPAIAHALGSADVVDASGLVRILRGEELLLVVDNAEHLRDAACLFVELARGAPDVTVLVTSRAVLHISGEHVFPVAPLDETDAAELFVQRARALNPGFSRAADNEGDIGAICRQVDCLPLAIELAAARARSLNLSELRERLGERLAFLTTGPRDLPARQQTLRATLEWSADQLSERERSSLARVSTFTGSWSLEAAQSVCDVGLDDLSALVDHSLVLAPLELETRRFTMLETVREFARELLEATGELEALQRRHADYYLALAEEAEPELAGPNQAAWFDRLEQEHDELRVALVRLGRFGDSSGAIRLAAALGRFRYVRGYLAEGRMAIESALSMVGQEPPTVRAKAFRVASALSVLLGEYERALELARSGLALYEEARDQIGIARSLSNIGAILSSLGHAEEAGKVLERSAALARSLGDERALALALNNRGDVALTLSDWETADERFRESLELLHRVGDEANVARSLFNIGVATLERGNAAEARGYLSESLERCFVLDDKEDIAWCLVAFASLYEEDGEAGRAAKLLGAADHLLSGIGARLKPYEQGLFARVEARTDRRLGHPEAAAMRQEGATLAVADAIELALNAPLARR